LHTVPAPLLCGCRSQQFAFNLLARIVSKVDYLLDLHT